MKQDVLNETFPKAKESGGKSNRKFILLGFISPEFDIEKISNFCP